MHKMFLIIQSKSPLPIPTEVKSDLFLVIKRRLFPPKSRGQDAARSKKKGGGGRGCYY